jgi:hypothetical protein
LSKKWGPPQVLDELVLQDSNTYKACEAFFNWTEHHQLRDRYKQPIPLDIYGDATGTAHDSTASRTDWQIVRDFFKRYPDLYRPVFHLPKDNPGVKDRVNCVNARLKSHAGDRFVNIHPRCKHLIEDLERVHWKTDSNGVSLPQLDNSNRALTHTSDALGYLIARKFGMRPRAGLQPDYVA